MNLNKIAQGGRKVVIRQVVGPDGVKRLTVLRHEGGATCANSNDEALIRKLNEMQITGFGGGGEELDSGKTNEFFEEKRKKVAPSKIPGKKTTPSANEDEEEEESPSRRKLDLGFGV